MYLATPPDRGVRIADTTSPLAVQGPTFVWDLSGAASLAQAVTGDANRDRRLGHFHVSPRNGREELVLDVERVPNALQSGGVVGEHGRPHAVK